VRGGLIRVIPVLIVGAFALILNTFPVEAYQKAITTFMGGFLPLLFNAVNVATFGVLSLYMTFSISRTYTYLKGDEEVSSFGAAISSVAVFLILAGVDLPIFSTDCTGPKSMFLAIIAALVSSWAYIRLDRLLRGRRTRLYSTGADREFNRMLTTMAPITIIVVVTALLDHIVTRVFAVDSFRELLANLFNWIFHFGEVGFFKGFLFVLLSSVLWLFGIHGSDTLENAMQTYFVPNLAANQAAVAAGQAPTHVLTKEFFDCFVLMGGCGTTICLLIALLLFSRNRARRNLALTAAFPMIFNINELMVFGLPVVLNPILLIPFLTVPLVCYSVAYLALSTGLVPMIASEVTWTTPIILGGIRATGSAGGAVLQVVNVILGVIIYMPFVRMLDKHGAEEAERAFEDFMAFYKAQEANPGARRIIDRNDVYGDFARGVAAELRYGLERGGVVMAYQPQYHYDGRCIGVEALLRWRHPTHGVLYPPLVVEMAREGGFLPELEKAVVRRVLADRERVRAKFGKDVKISFNVTGTTVLSESYLGFLESLNAREPFAGQNLCVEITEQDALTFDEKTMSTFRRIHEMGLLLAIDDFSMGQTSLNYLKEKLFDLIKLDGSLVKGLSTHENVREIILSITRLSDSLGMSVLAEFVETEEQRETLHQIGCDRYQGYLYSPAVFLDDEKK
ncbi:MAG: PTS sugar transporter subunit IIC/EAL domain-containing protein, partial [Clostridia bacterium]|nr:PTS sugar transporter subunit IIC/EAL domain-containing protein [Clostridia bacterium]